MIDLQKEFKSRISLLYVVASLWMVWVVYLKSHLDYDRFHSNSDRIYLLTTKLKTAHETATTSISSWTTASNIPSNSAFIDQTARLAHSQLRLKGDLPYATDAIFTDASIFEIFDLPLTLGDPKTALNRPQSIVLTQNAAFQLFGHQNPIGRLVFLQDLDCAATVTAVAKNLPDHSQIKTGAFISMPTLGKLRDSARHKGPGAISVLTYILLKPNVSAKSAQEELSIIFSGDTVAKPNLLSNQKTIILKPLRAALLNPVLSPFQVCAILTLSLLVFLMLLASIGRVVKIILLKISLSADYMTITLMERNKKLIWKTFRITAVVYLFSYLSSLLLTFGLRSIFHISVTEHDNAALYIGVGMLVILFTITIFSSLRVACLATEEPIKTYLALKNKR